MALTRESMNRNLSETAGCGDRHHRRDRWLCGRLTASGNGNGGVVEWQRKKHRAKLFMMRWAEGQPAPGCRDMEVHKGLGSQSSL